MKSFSSRFEALILVVLSGLIFSACTNFFNGSTLKDQLDQEIKYSNTPSVQVLFTQDSSLSGTLIPSGNQTLKQGISSEISISVNEGWTFRKWIALDASGKETDSVKFDNPRKSKTNVTVLTTEAVTIKPLFYVTTDNKKPTINSCSLTVLKKDGTETSLTSTDQTYETYEEGKMFVLSSAYTKDFSFTVDASDEDTYIDHIEITETEPLYYNGNKAHVALSHTFEVNDGTAPLSQNFTLSSPAEGLIQLEIYAVDMGGNKSEPFRYYVLWDERAILYQAVFTNDSDLAEYKNICLKINGTYVTSENQETYLKEPLGTKVSIEMKVDGQSIESSYDSENHLVWTVPFDSAETNKPVEITVKDDFENISTYSSYFPKDTPQAFASKLPYLNQESSYEPEGTFLILSEDPLEEDSDVSVSRELGSSFSHGNKNLVQLKYTKTAEDVSFDLRSFSSFVKDYYFDMSTGYESIVDSRSIIPDWQTTSDSTYAPKLFYNKDDYDSYINSSEKNPAFLFTIGKGSCTDTVKVTVKTDFSRWQENTVYWCIAGADDYYRCDADLVKELKKESFSESEISFEVKMPDLSTPTAIINKCQLKIFALNTDENGKGRGGKLNEEVQYEEKEDGIFFTPYEQNETLYVSDYTPPVVDYFGYEMQSHQIYLNIYDVQNAGGKEIKDGELYLVPCTSAELDSIKNLSFDELSGNFAENKATGGNSVPLKIIKSSDDDVSVTKTKLFKNYILHLHENASVQWLFCTASIYGYPENDYAVFVKARDDAGNECFTYAGYFSYRTFQNPPSLSQDSDGDIIINHNMAEEEKNSISMYAVKEYIDNNWEVITYDGDDDDYENDEEYRCTRNALGYLFDYSVYFNSGVWDHTDYYGHKENLVYKTIKTRSSTAKSACFLRVQKYSVNSTTTLELNTSTGHATYDGSYNYPWTNDIVLDSYSPNNLYSCPVYFWTGLKNGNTAAAKEVSETLTGNFIAYTDWPVLAQEIYIENGYVTKASLNLSGWTAEDWEGFTPEDHKVNVKVLAESADGSSIVSSVYSTSTDDIPSGASWVTVFHFADGTSQVSFLKTN